MADAQQAQYSSAAFQHPNVQFGAPVHVPQARAAPLVARPQPKNGRAFGYQTQGIAAPAVGVQSQSVGVQSAGVQSSGGSCSGGGCANGGWFFLLREDFRTGNF